MGEITTHRPVLLIAAVTSRYDQALQWTAENTAAQWGTLVYESPVFDFTETSFYTESMGTELKKQFLAFETLIDPGSIAPTKLKSNDWEKQYAESNDHPEIRPLNIDPGYISEAKLVLVTTKDRDHRLYLEQGIFAEVTLYYRSGEWNSSRWTYPDYQREDFQAFFTKCRDYLRERIRKLRSDEQTAS
ncbi:MAG: DUF4416 family protein [Mariniblastus sp.]